MTENIRTGPIASALSSEEWKENLGILAEERAKGMEPGSIWSHFYQYLGDSDNERISEIALNNAALSDSEGRKITREDVADVRFGAATLRSLATSGSVRVADDAAAERLDRFADVLQSYLPREEP